jgi:uncharacterized protein (DUF2249 family)
MDPVWQQVLRNLGHQLDKDVLPGLYLRAGLRTDVIRAELDRLGVPYYDPTTGRTPSASELEAAAEVIAFRAARAGTLTGGVAGFAGLLAVPPELVASLVQTLRLGQRLAVVYGHDPDTDKGKLLLWKAIAAAYEVDLPAEGPLEWRLQQLAVSMQTRAESMRSSTDWLARTLAVRVAVSFSSRVSRLIPGLGAGLGAWEGRRRLQEQAVRMTPVFRRAWDGALYIEGAIEDAVEVPRRARS